MNWASEGQVVKKERDIKRLIVEGQGRRKYLEDENTSARPAIFGCWGLEYVYQLVRTIPIIYFLQHKRQAAQGQKR